MARDHGEELDEPLDAADAAQARHDSPPRAAIVPTVLPRCRTGNRLQEDELRRKSMQLDPLNDALVKIYNAEQLEIQR